MALSEETKRYIYEQVAAKANQSTNVKELRHKADEMQKAFKKDIEAFNAEIKKAGEELLHKYGIEYQFEPTVLVEYKWHLPASKECSDAENNLLNKIRVEARNIIATMELGGDKADLMKMLDALEF